MSYEIIDERQFIELEKGIYLPFICSGSNNCTQISRKTGREVRARDWSLVTGYYKGCTIQEIYEYCSVGASDKNDELTCIKRNGKFLTNKDWENYIMKGVKKAVSLNVFLKRNTLEFKAYTTGVSPDGRVAYDTIGSFKIKEAEDYLKGISAIEEEFAVLKETNPEQYEDFRIYFIINNGDSKVYRAKPHKPFAFKQCNNNFPPESKLVTRYVKDDKEKNNVYIKEKSTLEKDLDDYFKYIENPLYDLTDEDIDFAIEKMNTKYFTGAKCPKCGKDLIPSVVPGYTYQCLSCDEDFYKCEL